MINQINEVKQKLGKLFDKVTFLYPSLEFICEKQNTYVFSNETDKQARSIIEKYFEIEMAKIHAFDLNLYYTYTIKPELKTNKEK